MNTQIARMRLRRHAWLAGITCLHIAAFMAWRDTPMPQHGLAQRESTLLLVQLPAAQPAAAARPPAAVAHTAKLAAARSATTPIAAVPDAPASNAAARDDEASPAPVLPDDPFARPSAPALGTLARARLAAAGVDRQLRKESLNTFASIVDEEKADRYSINGPAYRPPPPDESFADGRGIIHKRYMVRGKMVCETVDHVSPAAFQKGSQARIVRCPK